MNDAALSIAPSSAPTTSVPAKIAAPPTVTVMKTLATNASASEARERRPQCEGHHVNGRRMDAQCRYHVGVLHGATSDETELGSVEHPPRERDQKARRRDHE